MTYDTLSIRQRIGLALAALALAAALAGPAEARSHREQDRAHSAVRSGQALPLSAILPGLRRQFPGRILDARLRQDGQGNAWYDIRVLSPQGQVSDVTVNALTGRVVGVR